MPGSRFRYVIVAALAAVALAACSSSAKTSSPSTTAATTPTTVAATATTAAVATPSTGATATNPTVAVATTKLGKVLVDSNGMTLYTSSGDTSPGTSSCTGGCATIWPPLAVTGTATYGTGLSASSFTTITRSDGSKQLAYKGKPLYTFASDSAAGDTTGQGVGGFSVAIAS
jgi:predicted lipoprotein with Yx(FWY)xxD motif